ncbi:MAG: TraB/GumN family protein [Gammaproteobacteria bacterium]|nr:MAG: TraB/GumN family protein [Gammaproteobacteria bacterium]
MRRYLIIIFLFPAVCFSETSLWQISKNGNTLYLGGTIHVLKKEDYPLPVEYSEAFKKSDKLILEANIEAARSPEFGKKVAKMLTYPPGKSLKNAISEKTFNKLKKYLADRNIPIESFLRYKPQMIVLVVTVLELKKIGMVDIGVDEYFYNKAKQAGKGIGYFETIDEQLEFIRTMGQGNEDSMLLSTINDMDQIESMMSIIKSAWLTGDENKMTKAALTDMMRDHPETYQSLLVNRNNSWMPEIEHMMRNKKVEMVLVGALHLVGKDGLLQQLRNKGYIVKKF